MPALEQSVVEGLTERLSRFLKGLGGYGAPTYLDSGGSAAVFRVDGPDGARAIKACSPHLLTGPSAIAERRRLAIQSSLIGHSCPSLIQTYRVAEAEGTAFVEMEFLDWPGLVGVLPTIPDEAVAPLFTQLVEAVKFLDVANIVHRDIKPENIKVSVDFAKLKLLDLGVARELELSGEDSAALTDHGIHRPFLATAQYSSPEYLFRLDEPSPKLWRGLTFYQLGAVLHDLIMKEPIFQHEMTMGNRWLVARAVLTKLPSFADTSPGRLAHLKALALRCLTKDLDARLQQVSWDDFVLEGAGDPLASLRARLAKGRTSAGGQTKAAAASRLDFDRAEFTQRLIERVRADLLPACGTNLPLKVKPSPPGEPPYVQFIFTVNKRIQIECLVRFAWQAELYERTTHLLLQSRILCVGHDEGPNHACSRVVGAAAISENEAESAAILSSSLATVLGFGLDFAEATDDADALHAVDLQKEENK